MFLRLLVAFIVVPWVELYLLISIGQFIGAPATLAIIVLTGIVGAWLARLQGLKAWRRVQNALQQGRLPADEMLDGFLVLVAAILLVTPGLITDTVGFLFLVPASRVVLKGFLVAYFRRRFTVVTHSSGEASVDGTESRGPGPMGADDEVIDVKARTISEEES